MRLVPICLNFGVRLATGDYVAFLDDDDTWHPEKLDRQLHHFASTPNLAMSFTGYQYNYGNRGVFVWLDVGPLGVGGGAAIPGQRQVGSAWHGLMRAMGVRMPHALNVSAAARRRIRRAVR